MTYLPLQLPVTSFPGTIQRAPVPSGMIHFILSNDTRSTHLKRGKWTFWRSEIQSSWDEFSLLVRARFVQRRAAHLMKQIAEKRIHEQLGQGTLSIVEGPFWSVEEREESSVYLEIYFKRNKRGTIEGGSH